MTFDWLPVPSERSQGEAGARLRFGHIEADLDTGELRADGRLLDIEPQPCKLLLHLIRHRHRVVSRVELVREVWGCEVSKDALGRALLKARRAIGDDKLNPALSTVPRVGYRFTATVNGDGRRTRDQAESIFLAFLPFENATHDPALAWVQLGLPVLVGQALSRDARISLVPMSSVNGALGGCHGANLAEQGAAVQRATGASVVVHGKVNRTSGRLRLDLRLLKGHGKESGSILETDASKLAASLVESLGRRLGVDTGNAVAALDLPQDPLAAEACVRGRQAAAEQRTDVAINLYRLSLELEPGHDSIVLELLNLLSRTTTGATAEIPTMAADLLSKAQAAGDRRTMVNVHLALAHWCACRYQPVQSEAEVRRALELSDGSEGPMFWGDVHARLAVAAYGQGRQDEARQHLARARPLLQHGGDRVRLMATLIIESGIHITAGEYGRATELALGVTQEARQLGLRRTMGHACNNASMGLIGLGRVDEAVAHAAEGFACAASVSDRTAMDHVAETAAFACRLAGRPAVAGRVLAELDASSTGAPYSAGVVSLAHGFRHACRGDWQQAARDARWAFEDAKSTQHTRFAAYAFPWYVEALVLSGSLDEAQAELDVTDPAMLATCERGVHVFLVRAALAHRRGERQAALRWLAQALGVDPAPLWRAWACADAAWLHAEEGRFEEGAHLLEGLDGPLARLSVVIAARARVSHASGDVRAAAALHQQYVAARQEPGWHDYFERLGVEYERHVGGSTEGLPPIPFLPSRLC